MSVIANYVYLEPFPVDWRDEYKQSTCAE